MRFILKHRDAPIVLFEANADASSEAIHSNILAKFQEGCGFFPFGYDFSNDGLDEWLRHCIISDD